MKTKTQYTVKPSEKLFLEFLNDFISLRKFAEYHATTEKKMFKILMQSKEMTKQEDKQFKII